MMHIVKAKDHRHRGIRDQIFGEVIKILTDQDEADTKFANFTRHSVHDVLVIGRHKLMRLVDDNEGVGIVALAARLRLEKQALEQNFRSEEHTSELQSLMSISYAVFCLKQKIENTRQYT